MNLLRQFSNALILCHSPPLSSLHVRRILSYHLHDLTSVISITVQIIQSSIYCGVSSLKPYLSSWTGETDEVRRRQSSKETIVSTFLGRHDHHISQNCNAMCRLGLGIGFNFWQMHKEEIYRLLHLIVIKSFLFMMFMAVRCNGWTKAKTKGRRRYQNWVLWHIGYPVLGLCLELISILRTRHHSTTECVK